MSPSSRSRTCLRLASALLPLLLVGCDEKTAPTAEPEPAVEAPAESPPDEEPKAEASEPPEASQPREDGEPAEEPAAPEKAAASPKPASGTPATVKNPPTAGSEPKSAEAKPTGPVVGKPWQVVASATADPGYKCNDEYPHKFTTSGGSNVSYPDAKPRGSCAGKNGVAVTVPFVPTAAGPGAVSGTLSYGICDDAKTNCVVKKKQVTLAFNASAAP